jgi:outer membrane protein TolC
VTIEDDGMVKLDINSAVHLAYIHSPFHQRQLETLYLSALDVTADRFRLDTQFFGGYDARYAHNGSLIPAGLSYSPLLNRFVITPAIDGEGVENNRVTLGRPFGANPALQARRRFATAGELLVGFANTFVFEFTGGDVNLASSLANFSFIQPLLRGAGKDVALEQLTFEERKLLANLRAYGQFRQGFYTQIVIGELGVTGPQRGGIGTNLQSFSGQGGVGGYLGLLQQLQQIRNAEENLNLQLRTRDRLEALLENDLIDLVQVDQFRQNVEAERANLLLRRNALALALDRYKTSTLGLPPDLPIDLDDSLIRQFELVPAEATDLQNSIIELQRRVADLPDEPEVVAVEQLMDDAAQLVDPIWQLFGRVRQDLGHMDEVMPQRGQMMTEDERSRLSSDRAQLGKRLADLEQQFDLRSAELVKMRDRLSMESARATARGLVTWVAEAQQLVDRLILVPARARLEAITVDSVSLPSEEAFRIALANRLDFMNGRAALVDRWRLIQVEADSLQSVLDLTASGDIRTARNNPLSFRAPTSSMRVGVEFDAPLTRYLERNAYRESLIEYQRSRRDFIQSRDGLHLGVRELLRQIEQLGQNLEIQRRAVTIAIRRVDQTQLLLNPPRPAPQPGQRPPINPTTAINLLSAQTSLRDTQNSFLNAWLEYYAARMRLYRELGIMELDAAGRWIERPIGGSVDNEPTGTDDLEREELPLPPRIPDDWTALAEDLPQSLDPPKKTTFDATVVHSGELVRLPPPANRADTNGYNSSAH